MYFTIDYRIHGLKCNLLCIPLDYSKWVMYFKYIGIFWCLLSKLNPGVSLHISVYLLSIFHITEECAVLTSNGLHVTEYLECKIWVTVTFLKSVNQNTVTFLKSK